MSSKDSKDLFKSLFQNSEHFYRDTGALFRALDNIEEVKQDFTKHADRLNMPLPNKV